AALLLVAQDVQYFDSARSAVFRVLRDVGVYDAVDQSSRIVGFWQLAPDIDDVILLSDGYRNALLQQSDSVVAISERFELRILLRLCARGQQGSGTDYLRLRIEIGRRLADLSVGSERAWQGAFDIHA